MKKRLMRYISIILASLTLIAGIPINASAWFSDVPENAAYRDALNRLTSLGIVAGQDKFNPDSPLTREQFAKMICSAAGLDSLADSMKGPTDFPDVSASAWSSGYINAATSKGYITALSDGKFHPTQAITFSQLCTILVKSLGYNIAELPGTWPNNAVAKAYDLGLTDGISLKNDAAVPRWAAVTMVDRFLDTNMKQNAAGSTTQTFMESTGNFTKCIVFGDSSTMSSLTKGQVSTNKGTYNNPSNIKLELGSENYIVEKNGNITKASGQSSVLKVSVDQVAENKVYYKVGDSTQSIVLPDNIIYYYQGKEIKLADLSTILKKSASIVFNYNSDKNGYAFAVVFDPVYSKPEIAENFVPSSGRLGSISFSGDSQIIRDEEFIDISQIEEKDVVYQVTDIWGGNKYIDVVDKKVGGKITGIAPNKLSPKTLQIDNVDYGFSQDINLSRITGSFDFTVDNNIVVYLGHDGKIVNVEGFGTQDNSDYAVVLNSGASISTGISGTKTYIYTAKLLFSDGVTATYDVTTNASVLKGQLVKYKFTDSQTVSLEQLSYNFPGETNIKKDERMMGDSYVADNVKIFNVVYNDTGSEVTANILKWSDLPGGTIPNGKIWYTSTTGTFNDISVIFTDDVLNQRYKTGMIKSTGFSQSAQGTSYNYTVLIDGKEYKYNVYDANFAVGNAFKFEMTSSGISSVLQSVAQAVTATNIQAVDSRRIKLKDKVYYFNSNVSVYYRDSNGTITAKTLADIDISQTYQTVALYTDNSNDKNSKVNIIYLVE